MNQKLLNLILAALNAGRQQAVQPIRQGMESLRTAGAAAPELKAPVETYCGLVNGALDTRLTELPADVAAGVTAAVDELVAQRVQETLNGRLTSGELVTKEAHAKALELATETGRKAGVDEATAAQRTREARRTLVTENGLPLPDDALLGGTDAEFTARLELAKAHKKQRTELTLNGEPFTADLNDWADQETWKVTYNGVVAAIKQVEAKKPGGAPAKKPDGAGGGAAAGNADIAFM